MITRSIIKILKNDTTICTLLGAVDADSCPVFTTFNFDNTVDKQVNVSLEYGETRPFDQDAKTHDGRMRVYVLVKDTVSEPINVMHQIASRVLALLDLKGTTLDTSNLIYWVQKLDTDFTHYVDLHFYELTITFRFVNKEV